MDGTEKTDQREKRRQKLHDFNREHILEAAARVIEEHGFDKTTMEEVARKAGVAVGTLYNYFASKDELAIAVLRRHMRQLSDVLAVDLPRSLSLEKALCWYLEEILRLVEKHRTLYLNMASRIHEVGPRAAGLDFDRIRAEADATEKRLAALITSRLGGQPTRARPEDIGWVLLGMIRGYCFRSVLLGKPDERPIEEVAALIVQLLLYGACGKVP